MKVTGLSIVGNGFAKTAGKPQAAINPATGSAIGPDFFLATTDDVNAAAALAAKAFIEFRCWPGKKRQGFLNRIAELLEADGPAIVERATQETALAAGRLQNELARTCFQLRLYGEAAGSGSCAGACIDHADPDRKPLPKPDLHSMSVPLGPVVVFSASNFPLAFSVAGGDTASAFAAGCPVIVKAHQAHLGTSELVGLIVRQAAVECGAPEGVFSMLQGDRDIGIALVKHPLLKAVGFTGSRIAGRALMDAAAARPEPIPVYAEMGSINPVFVLDKALDQRADEIAAGLHGSVTLGIGQFCTNPGLVFIESGAGGLKFLAKMKDLMSATAPGTMLNSGLCSAYHRGVEKFAQTAGVKALTLVDPDSGPGKALAGAALFITDVETFLKHPHLQDEVFGPSTLVVECSSPAQMLAAASQLEGQLTATILAASDELKANRQLIEILTTKAGRLIFNGYPTGVEVTYAMTHGGPFPATSDGRSTSVGPRAIERFQRQICYQNFPETSLPDELRDDNPLSISRWINGKLTTPATC